MVGPGFALTRDAGRRPALRERRERSDPGRGSHALAGDGLPFLLRGVASNLLLPRFGGVPVEHHEVAGLRTQSVGSVGPVFSESVDQLVGDGLAAPGQRPEAMERVALGGAVARPAAREPLAGELRDDGADAAPHTAREAPGREQDVVEVNRGAHTSDAIASNCGGRPRPFRRVGAPASGQHGLAGLRFGDGRQWREWKSVPAGGG